MSIQIMTSDYSTHNSQIIHNYWKMFRESGKKEFEAKCWQNIIRSEVFENKIDQISNGMFVEDSEQRKNMINGLVKIYFFDEINYIYTNRFALVPAPASRSGSGLGLGSGSGSGLGLASASAEKPSQISLSKLKLFDWMKNTNPVQYENFKRILSAMLQNLISLSIYTNNEIKTLIASFISKTLQNHFICL